MSTHAGLAAGHAGADTAAAHAGSSWTEQAAQAFKEYATQNEWLTTEQVRAAYPDLPKPPDKRAWGAIPRLAQRDGVVVPHGWVRATSPTVHGMVGTLWASRVNKEASTCDQ